MRRHIDSGRERLGETLKASIVPTGLGEFVKSSLGILDLITWRKIDRCVVGDVDHVLANLDQSATDRQVIDRMAVVLCIDDCRCLGGEPSKVLADGEATNINSGVEKCLKRDWSRQLARADKIAGKLIDLLMDRLEEMRRFQKIGNAVIGLVVDEYGAQQRLFRLYIVRSGTIERGRFFDLLAGCRISEGHGYWCLPGNCGIARGL